jgi:hypothetical protein
VDGIAMARRRQNHQNPEDDPAGGDDRPPAHRLVQAVAREDRVGHELHRAERGQEGLRREREGHEVHHAAEHEQRPSAEAHQHAAALGRDAQPLGLLVLVVAHLDHVRAQVDEHIPGHLRRRVHTQTDCGLRAMRCAAPNERRMCRAEASHVDQRADHPVRAAFVRELR